MPSICRILTFACLAFAVSFAAFAGETDPEGHRLLKAWQDAAFGISSVPPVSFTLDGTPSAELCANWVQAQREEPGETATSFVRKLTNPEGTLELRLEGKVYHDYPVIEWTVFLRNTGTADTGIFEKLRSCDSVLGLFGGDPLTLHQNKGDTCTADSFEPFQTAFAPGADLAVANTGGRPTQTAFPYFNLEGKGRGVIFVDRKSTRLNSSHYALSRMPSSA